MRRWPTEAVLYRWAAFAVGAAVLMHQLVVGPAQPWLVWAATVAMGLPAAAGVDRLGARRPGESGDTGPRPPSAPPP